MPEVNEIKRLFLVKQKTQQEADADDSGPYSMSHTFEPDGPLHVLRGTCVTRTYPKIQAVFVLLNRKVENTAAVQMKLLVEPLHIQHCFLL